MSVPTGGQSYREIRSSGSFDKVVTDDLAQREKEIIEEHLSNGWVLEPGTADEIVFSNKIVDGRKWTRHYDRRNCLYTCQRFYEIDSVITALDWPPGHFGD